jgi:hypothetical protein
MIRKHPLLIVLALSTLVSAATSQIELKGTVKDKSGSPVAGATVSLTKKTLKATTDAKGEFTISDAVGTIAQQISGRNEANFLINGHKVFFTLAPEVKNVSLSIISANGQKIFESSFDNVSKNVSELPQLKSGVYLFKLSAGQQQVVQKIITTGDQLIFSDIVSNMNSGSSLGLRLASAASVDTIVATKSGFVSAKLGIDAYKKTGITITLEPEGPIGECKLPDLPAGSALTKVNEKLPDPFTFYDGTKMTKKSQWPCRRKEILAMAQKYIYGPTPPVDAPEAEITGTISGGTVKADIKYNGTSKSVSFNIGSGSGKVLCVAYGSGISPSGCRSWSIQNAQMDEYSNAAKGVYGTAPGCRIMAAVWAVNVVCKVIKQNPSCGIEKIMTTGCSASGKSAFVTGAFCEGVDLTVVVESGGIGAASYRMAEWFKHGAGSSRWKCADAKPQNLDNTDNGSFSGSPYFSTSVASWVASAANIKNINKLPYDQHCLMACTAPRALCALTNANGQNQWCHLGGTCEALTAWAAEPVWNALGVPENMGFQLPNVYDHCTVPAAHTDLAKEFFKRVFDGDKTAKTDVGNIGSGVQQPVSEWKETWVDWNMETKLE